MSMIKKMMMGMIAQEVKILEEFLVIKMKLEPKKTLA